ncbi:hypothetical protein BJX61DRAFT_14120 [Aspergillus egyptiacus]|nr:hypothetical protein BJX61DRAFT_14120 [Aspergillus egyptiacus]
MNIWSGAIALDDQSQLQSLQLIDRSASWQSDLLKGSTLGFRSFVNPALVPLYARVGPNLELHTNDPETTQWLKHKLLGNIWLDDDELDHFQNIQCPVGFLVNLDGATRPRTAGTTTTDLLIYGVLSSTSSHEHRPSPPTSSSPENEDTISGIVKQRLRVYATPISGSLITRAQALPCRDDLENFAGHEQYAQFLPDLHSPSPKRKRVATLFESVAQHHKRVRHKGGEGVSLMMASQSTQQLQNFNIKRESEEPALPMLSKIASHRSRSLSTSSNLNPNKVLDSRADIPRPSSNRGLPRELTSKRGTPASTPFPESLSRKDRGCSPAVLSSEGKEPLSRSKDADAIISDNKNTITRTILTCMRLYGYNRTTRPVSSHKFMSGDGAASHGEGKDSQTPSDNMTLPSSTSCSDEDEFKAMYHATYRASTFALRKYLKETPSGGDGSSTIPPVLDKAKAMTYIDGFLKLFCEEEH